MLSMAMDGYYDNDDEYEDDIDLEEEEYDGEEEWRIYGSK